MTQDHSTAPISAVFPYYNEQESLSHTLEMISTQTRMPAQVVFVNSSSTDGSSEMIDGWIANNSEKYPTTEFLNIFKGTNNPASSKNAGVDSSSSPFVAFMDCGLQFPKHWLESQWNIIKDSQEKVVSGVCHFKGVGLWDSCAVAQTYGYQRSRPTTPSTVIAREQFEASGRFIENRRSGYDAVWPLQLKHHGIDRVINQEVVIQYMGTNFSPTPKAILKKSYTYSVPTVGLPHYKVPYYYVAVGILAVTAMATSVLPVSFAIGGYIAARGFLIPLRKSRNLKIFRDHPLAVLGLPLIGLAMDIGRFSGTIVGILKYHILASHN